VRVANLLVVQEWAGTGTALSYLVLSSLLPKALLAPIGGLLADRFDRRNMMVIMDALAGCVVLGFLVAVQYQSVEILFIVTGLRSAISAMYYPITYGLLPLMVPNDQDMQYAGSIATSVYGLMSMLGGLVAGSTAALIGMKACYAIDSSTYIISAIVMCTCVKGNFRGNGGQRRNNRDSNEDATVVEDSTTLAPSVMDESLADEPAKALEVSKTATKTTTSRRNNNRCNQCVETLFCGAGTTIRYLISSGCGVLIFLKATDSLIWGPGDVIGIEIATVRNPDGSENEELSAYRMGLYYCFSGLGVFLGPTLANFFSSATRPISLQRSCLVAILITVTGWIMAAHAPNYTYFLLSQWWSGIGYGTLWAYSSLMLQLMIDSAMLGRVLSMEYFFYVVAEMITSSATGPLYDKGLTTQELCYFGAAVAFAALIFWSFVHACGWGAARPQFNPDLHRDHDDGSNAAFSDVPIAVASAKKDPSSPGSAKSGGTAGSLSRRKTASINKSIANEDVEFASNPGPGPIPALVGVKEKRRNASPSSQRPAPRAVPPPNSFPKKPALKPALKPAAVDITAALAFDGAPPITPPQDENV